MTRTSSRVTLFEQALRRLEEGLYDEDSAKSIYRALAGYAQLLGRLLEKLKEGERRRVHESDR